jgi:hypothetical protein
MEIAMSVLVEPRLPAAVGPVSSALIERLTQLAPETELEPIAVPLAEADPYGLDVQLALTVCFELHYRGFSEVDSRWEWDGGLVHLRVQLENLFLGAVRRDVGSVDGVSATAEMDAISVEATKGWGPSYFLRDRGDWEQMQEYFVHRSVYHLKEGDPHAWAIPRLTGQAKASFVAVEFDEFGAGRGTRVHQRLFADLLAAAGLDDTYLGYQDQVPAVSLAPVNLMSIFGLRRSLRGAAVGHFAATEITSPRGSYRMMQALRRLCAPEACVAFYAEHVEADAVHEQVVRTDVVGDLLRREPELEPDVVFGIRAFGLVEDRLADYLMERWLSGQSSLRSSPD